MQRIFVCAEDPVLAKKVRFLMERDDCKVEILPSPDAIGPRLEGTKPTLMVLSRSLANGDAIELVAGMDPGLDLPPVLVLGGEPRVTAEFIHLLPDPVDTQAIYREATRLLHSANSVDSGPATTVETPILPDIEEDEDIGLATDGALDTIAEELDALESEQLDEQISEAFNLEDEPPPMQDPQPTTAEVDAPPAPSESAPLEPASFARALHEAWSSGRDGALVVERDDERLTIRFEKGRPFEVSSNHPGDLLGKALVDRGRLTHSQYAEAAMRAIERGTRLEASVLSLNYLNEDELGAEMGTSARELLVGCFAAHEGQFWAENDIAPAGERAYRLEVGHIIAQGLRSHASESIIDGILGEALSSYFELRRPGFELQKDFPLSKADLQFLEYEGRAYNVEDASDAAGLPLSEARRLLAILAVCQEVEPFSPGAEEFEARIREERETRKELESQMPGFNGANASSSALPAPLPEDEQTRLEPPSMPPPSAPPPFAPPGVAAPFPPPEKASEPPAVPSFGASSESAPPPPPAPTSPAPPPMPSPSTAPPPPAPTDTDIPPMPLPPAGEGVVPRPLAYAKPLPRGPDGSLLDTPERAISREHFQNGVNLLGKGNFSSAEEHFRDAVALCSEEHVYLIGLARAIYYNPNYRADGKVPVLRSIVDRAKNLAPDDKRVSTLEAWVKHAETTHS